MGVHQMEEEGCRVLYCHIDWSGTGRTELCGIYQELLYRKESFSIDWNLSESGTVFWADTKNSTGSGVSCIARCVRAECGRTSPFPVSEMWDYLVQWPWFFASCVQVADRIFFYETCGRAENKRRTLHLVWTQKCNMTKTLRRKTIMKKRALKQALFSFIYRKIIKTVFKINNG